MSTPFIKTYFNNLLYGSLNNKKTNIDLIRNMSDEELADWLSTFDDCPSLKRERTCDNNCHDCWLGWFKEEVED